MKSLFNALFFLAISFSGFCQEPVLGTRGYSDFNIGSRGFINSFSKAPEDIKPSDVYLYDYWRKASIYLTDSSKYSDLDIKVDVKDDELNIKYNGSVRVLPFRRLLALSFETYNENSEIYLNGGLIFGKEFPYYDQLFQVIHEGKVSLYSKSYVQVIEATTNAALSIDIEDKIVVKKNYFIKYKQHAIEIENKSGLKKELDNIFGNESKTLLKSINPKKEDDLLLLVSRIENLND